MRDVKLLSATATDKRFEAATMKILRLTNG